MARHHVCNIVKHKDEYPEFQLQRTRISPLRCKNCMHCPGCNKEKKGQLFNGNSKTCISCCTLWTCKPCGQNFLSVEFDTWNLRNYQRRERMDSLVCKSCRLDGYLPKDTTDYPCELCGVKGCDQFQEEKLEEYRKTIGIKKPKLFCKTCMQTHEHQSPSTP